MSSFDLGAEVRNQYNKHMSTITRIEMLEFCRTNFNTKNQRKMFIQATRNTLGFFYAKVVFIFTSESLLTWHRSL